MPHFVANLSMLFTEFPFLDRFAAAQKAGFKAVEFMFPYDYKLSDIKEVLHETSLKLVLFNLPAGNWAAGERGIALYPDRQEEFKNGVNNAVTYARELKTQRLNCLVGTISPNHTKAEQKAVLVENLRYAAEILQANGIELLIEPVNHFDIPEFFINKSGEALEVLTEVNHDNLYLQYDLYHAQREGENLLSTLHKHLTKIKNIQIADNPGRHQPGTGEMDYSLLLKEIDLSGYSGYVSMEYHPFPDTLTSLQWVKSFGLMF